MKLKAERFEHRVGPGLLLVQPIARLGDVELNDFKEGARRLVVFADEDELLDDSMVGYVFRQALGRRGLLSGVRAGLPGLVADLVPGAEQSAEWLREGLYVTIASQTAGAGLVAAVVLVAAGHAPAPAIAIVERALPGAFRDLDIEIAVSVFQDHVVLLRDLNRRRAEARQAGRSPWSVQ